MVKLVGWGIWFMKLKSNERLEIQMKICVKCKYFIEGIAPLLFPICEHPKAIENYCNLVTGKPPSCEEMRSVSPSPHTPVTEYCGKSGNWWESPDQT